MCPYFLARQFIQTADVIVYNVNYMLDPKIANLVSSELQKDCIVVFDECSNIDNTCIDAYSLHISEKTIKEASANLLMIES
jgi:DNA excision repair protein ERCC-2